MHVLHRCGLPLVLLVLVGVWGAWMNKACAFKPLRQPYWTQAENPGVALELAASADDVNRVLGDPSSGDRKENRDTAIRLQKFDFVFIPLYVLLFSARPLPTAGWPVPALSSVQFLVDQGRVSERSLADDEAKMYEARVYFNSFYGEEDVRIRVDLELKEFDRVPSPGSSIAWH